MPLYLYASGSVIDLSGSWEYAVISSENEYPLSHEKKWSTITIPSRDLFELIAEKRNIKKGYIVLRKYFNASFDKPLHLVFQAGEIMNSDITYINGKRIGRTGLFPPDFKSGWAKFRHYPVPPEFLKKGVNVIEIFVYFEGELWFLSPIRLIDEKSGNIENMYRSFIQNQFIHAFCIMLISFSIFFISIYFKRKKEVMYLYFSISTLLLADMTTLQFTENLYPYIPLSSLTIFKICAMGVLFFPPFLTFFFRSYLDMNVTETRVSLYLCLPLIFTIIIILTPERYDTIQWRNRYLLIVPVYISDIVIVSILQLIRRNRKVILLFFSLLPVFIFGVYDILVFSLHFFEGTVPLYPIGIPFIVVLIGVQLVNRFIFNLNQSERLNILLRERIEEGKRLAALENEISISKKIQLANIPRTLPEQNSFKIGARYIPADNISGDFYNFHSFEKDRLGILVADVSGHGIPASLISSMVKVLFSALASVYSDPVNFIKGLNGYIYDKMEGNLLTAGYCFIDRNVMKAYYSRAGHEPLLHLTFNNGKYELREYLPRGKVIGVDSEINPDVAIFTIRTGDRLILYSDGLIEIFNEKMEIFGNRQFMDLILDTANTDINNSIDIINRTLSGWSGGKPFNDDFTLIITEIK